MPINYKDYPTNWKTEIRPAILKRANNCCEICNVQNYSEGFRNKEGHFYTTEFIISKLENSGVDMFEDELFNCVQKNGQVKPIKIVLTIAHLDHDISNNDFSNLKALCQKCHLDYDKNYHKENRKNTLMKKKGIIKLTF
jgi:hypothetical protein